MNVPPGCHPRARVLFDQAFEHEPDARMSFLAEACAGDPDLQHEVEALLCRHDEAEEVLEEPCEPASEVSGDRIGPYKLLQRIGQGGFGTVWMAEQTEPVRRTVALKVLKAGMDSSQVIGRFEAERQALAMMDHPNIARVFDGGTSPRGRPYFVMELVRGLPITRFCDEAELSPRDRIELFVAVCHAVQHAHVKGVIHRDLKPTNVLVTLNDGKPVPKVIDFGIAKATQGRLTDRTVFTAFAQMVGTPEYMPPEQAELSGLDVDTRADVYSLGVLLYELLTGTRPFELETLLKDGYAAMLRTLKEVDPPKPSTRVSTLGDALSAVARLRRVPPTSLGSMFRGDLDCIVMKAMEKDRSRRYETAAGLAEDLLRHLRHEPVLAGPPGRWYRLQKYVRRHRVGVAASAAVTVAILVGTALSAVWYLQASAEGERARQAANIAEDQARAASLARLDEQREKEAAIAAREEARQQHGLAVAARAEEAHQRRLAEDRAEEARVAARKAQHVVELLEGMLRSSDPRVEKGRDYTVRQLLDDFANDLPADLAADPDVEATVRRVLGESYLNLGLPEAGQPHLERWAELTRTRHGAADERTVWAELTVSRSLREAGHLDDALAIARETTMRVERDAPAREDLLAACLGRTAAVLYDRQGAGDLAEAETTIARAIAIQRRNPPEDNDQFLENLSFHASILGSLGRFADAEPLYEEVLAGELAREGQDGIDVATARCSLAVIIYQRGGDLVRAEQLHRQALATRLDRLGEDHIDVAHSQNNLGMLLAAKGDWQAGLAMFERACSIRKRLLGDHPSVAKALQNLATALGRLDRNPEAIEAQTEAVAVLQRFYGADQPDLANALMMLGNCLLASGQTEHGVTRLDEARGMFERLGAVSDRRYAGVLFSIARALLGKEPGRAAALAEEAVGRLSEQPDAHLDLVFALKILGRARFVLGELKAADEALRKGLDLAHGKLQATWPEHRADLQETLARVHLARGALPEAEAMQREALQLIGAQSAPDQTRTAKLRDGLAETLRRRGLLAEAEIECRQALEVLGALGDPWRSTHADCLARLATILLQRDDPQGGEQAARACLEFREATTPGSPPHRKAQALLGRALMARGDAAAAEPLLREACASAAAPSWSQEELGAAVAALVVASERTGKQAQADEWRARLAR